MRQSARERRGWIHTNQNVTLQVDLEIGFGFPPTFLADHPYGEGRLRDLDCGTSSVAMPRSPPLSLQSSDLCLDTRQDAAYFMDIRAPGSTLYVSIVRCSESA